jgi:hypothetical protein
MSWQLERTSYPWVGVLVAELQAVRIVAGKSAAAGLVVAGIGYAEVALAAAAVAAAETP